MPQAVDCELLLYADDTCLQYQDKDITKIEIALKKNFSMLCGWFINHKLSIHFIFYILFGSKRKVKNSKLLNIQYNVIKIKQYSKVTYLGCVLDETHSIESMTIHIISNINSRLRIKVEPFLIGGFNFAMIINHYLIQVTNLLFLISLFTNAPLAKTIDIILKRVYSEKLLTTSLTKET